MRWPTWAAGAAAVSLALCGCSSLPDSGPVHEVKETAPSATPSSGAYYDPVRPQQGATREEIVAGFLDSMRASPVRTSVAREYLTVEAKADWHPENAIITYDSISTTTQGSFVAAAMEGAGRYDSIGVWQGRLSAQEQELTFTLKQENGQWRIAQAPDALVVPTVWFSEQYQRAARYFLDPSGRVLTPEPIFVARGDQLSTLLVKGLTATIPAALSDVVRTDVPVGLKSGLSVPVDSSGVAMVDLSGRVTQLSAEQRERIIAQFIWTLRQDARVRALRITLNGQPLGDGQDVALNGAASFDPAGQEADSALYAVRDGELVRGTLSDLQPVTDALPGLAKAAGIALSPSGSDIAVVDRTRTVLNLGNVGEGKLKQVATGNSILDPSWDLAGRLWLVDGGANARLRVVDDQGAIVEVAAPGITGQDVRQLLVSRDGTRVVALIHGEQRDRVVMARVRQSSSGTVQALTTAKELWFDSVPPLRYVALAWQGPSAVAAVSEYTSDSARVLVAGVDGAPVAVVGARQIRGRPRALIGTPADATRVLVVTDVGIMDSSTQTLVARAEKAVRLLGFTG